MPNETNPLGVFESPRDKRTLVHELLAPVATAAELPKSFSSRKEQSGVFRQYFGSCVGAGQRSVKEAEEKREHGVLQEFSYKMLYAMCKANDGIPDQEGTYPHIAMRILASIGINLASDWPNTSATTHKEFTKLPPQEIIDKAYAHRIDGFVQVTSLQGLKDALVKYKEVGLSFNVYETFDDPDSDGVIKPHGNVGYRGRHWVVATGYDDDKRLIEFKNSWGKSYGDDGYGYISYDYEGVGTTPFNEAYAAVDYVTATETVGAPVNLGYPTRNPYVTQKFGANFKNPDGTWHYPVGHPGVDWRAKIGDDILAIDDGEIIFSGWGGNVGGNVVQIKHSWGISWYGHLSGFNVSVGQKVVKGQVIAKAGDTGDTTAAHLHLGGKINGIKNPLYNDWIDLLPYINNKSMTKYFRIEQDNGNGTTKAGIMIVEGFSGTTLFENDWAEYQKLLQITGLSLNTPVVKVPAGKFFKLRDGNKLGIMVLDGFAGTVLFENDYAEYQTLLQISGMNEQTPQITLPN